MPNAIFIAGYYRSGTSALSGALQRLGVSIFNEAAANEHNPLGFYEVPELIEFDVSLLTKLGMEWTDVTRLPDGWPDRADIAPFTAKLDEILRRRYTQEIPLWALKHPHLCHLLPIYERAARLAGHKPHVIHIFRAPWVSAASQQLKNGLARAHALLLWLSYATAAERNARHLPRGWTTYADLLEDPEREFKKLEANTGLSLTGQKSGSLREACAYLTAQLNRSTPLVEDGLFPPLRNLVTRVWDAIRAGDFTPGSWDEFSRETDELAGFLAEISAGRARVLPGLGGGVTLPGIGGPARQINPLRPAERLDEGEKTRLLHLRDKEGALPTLGLVIAAPAGRAAALTETLECLRQQWAFPDEIVIVSADEVVIENHEIIRAAATPGGTTQKLCATLNQLAKRHSYVAALNAGDLLDPDACLRFKLTARANLPDLVYCDEIVPREGGAWVRYKPAWDITRLRQSAYLGDWAWYKAETLLQLGGFDASFAGAEEYELQLRLAETGANVLRLPEALFVRGAATRRDSIAPADFGAAAVRALESHLTRASIPAKVEPRQHLGLFKHLHEIPDPGTSFIMLCDGVDVPALNQWLTSMLAGTILTGPIILAGADLQMPVAHYLAQVTQQADALEGKVLAVKPRAGLHPAEALEEALAMVSTPHVAIIDTRAQPETPHWGAKLRAKLADPAVALAGARTLVPLAAGQKMAMVQGPIVTGASSRLGAAHLADAPGPGGWLLVDQEATAIAPPALLARAEALKACIFTHALSGDALWIDICAQLRATGAKIVWTPDISFIAPPAAIQLDAESDFRQGSRAARSLPWADEYHHPALSLHGDILAAEQRQGLLPSAPEDSESVLVTGTGAGADCILNAIRAGRAAGMLEASFAPEPLTSPEILRRAPGLWLRVNPSTPPAPFSPCHAAIFSQPPKNDAAIEAADALYATSPGLVTQLRKRARKAQEITLWRPALTRSLWENLEAGTGLNTNPRVLWIDDGNAPPWLPELINETASIAAWIVAERPGAQYSGAIARIPQQQGEQGWVRELSAIAPQIFIRPAGTDTSADHYPTLLAAAAGCHLLVDKRLDTPASLKPVLLPNIAEHWKASLRQAIVNLKDTLESGKRTRAAALAMASVEEISVPWVSASPVLHAAE